MKNIKDLARREIVKAQNSTKEGAERVKITRREMSKKSDFSQINEHEKAFLIDNAKELLQLKDHIKKLSQTKDVQGFIQDISSSAVIELAAIALQSDNEKAKLDALRDLLDRAGYGKVQKHAIARVDAKDSKEAIISQIMGAKKALAKNGIEIVDDEEDEDLIEGTGETK